MSIDGFQQNISITRDDILSLGGEISISRDTIYLPFVNDSPPFIIEYNGKIFNYFQIKWRRGRHMNVYKKKKLK